LWVKWTDRFGFEHEVVLNNKDETCTLLFPCEQTEIKWVHGGGEHRSSCPAKSLVAIDGLRNFDVQWCEVNFSYVESTIFNSHGIIVEFRGSDDIENSKYLHWESIINNLKNGKSCEEM
jgi:hypothetical protein